MKDFMETKTVHLKCLSPIHIGSGDGKLNPKQYVFDEQEGRVYLFKMNKWLEFLSNEQLQSIHNQNKKKILKGFDKLNQVFGNKIESYKQFAISKSSLSLYNWCEENNIDMPALDRYCFAKTYADCDKTTLNEIIPFVRHINGNVYIPGSSIKGAIRTALLCNLIKNAREYDEWEKELLAISKISTKIKADRKKIQKDYKNCIKRIERTIFNKNGIDVLSGLRISDAECKHKIDTRVYKKYDISLCKEGKKGNGISLYREHVPKGEKFTFTITLEKRLMDEIKIKNVDHLIRKIEQHATEIIELEKSVFGYDNEYWSGIENKVNLILGGGTGFLSKTIIYSILPKEAAIPIVRLCFRSGKHNVLDRKISPRTLKLAKSIHELQQIGLVKLTVD